MPAFQAASQALQGSAMPATTMAATIVLPQWPCLVAHSQRYCCCEQRSRTTLILRGSYDPQSVSSAGQLS